MAIPLNNRAKKANKTKFISTIKTILGVLTLALPISAVAQYQTYVIDTYGGESLIPVVRQQLDAVSAGSSVSVYQDKLVLRTTPAGYQAITQLLKQIDKAPQPILVAVRVGTTANNTNHIHQGQIQINQFGISTNGQFANQQTNEQQNSLYQVQTLSGKSASIRTSTLLSLTQPNQRVIYNNGYGQFGTFIQINGQTLVNSSQGITVTPRLLPNGQIEIQLKQIEDKLTGNQQTPIKSQQLNTTINIAKGQWTTIGYIRQSAQNNSPINNQYQQNSQPIQILVQSL